MRVPVAAVLLLGALSAGYLTYHEESGILGNPDTYAFFLPNLLYAVRAFHDGGRGLLWNPYQACGSPFFANPQAGLLYPPHWLFLVLDADVALRAVLVVDMTLAGLWTFLLCAEIGLGAVPALAGALLVAIGPTGAGLAKWSPMHVGSWTWMPAAMLCTERLLRRPTIKRAFALGIVLTLAVLPGFPQIVLFIYELIALRALWQLLTVPQSRRLAAVGYLAVGMLLPLGLGAIQLVPAMELVRESVRGHALPANEIREGAERVLESVVVQVRARAIMGAPIAMLSLLLVPFAFLRSPRASVARFYLTACLLAWALRLGPGTPVYDLYGRLPVVRLFQYPSRFIWVADYCVAMLTAIGLANVARLRGGLRPSTRWIGLVAVPVIGALLIVTARFVGWLSFEPILLLLATVALLTVFARGRSAAGIPVLLVALIAIEVFLRPPGPLHAVGPADRYRARAHSLAAAQHLVTPMDRVLVLHRRGFDVTPELILKTAMLFSLHGVADYEATPTRRFAEFFVMMMNGRSPKGVWDVQAVTSSAAITKATRRRLLDLLATRLLLSDPSRSEEPARLQPPLIRQLDAADLQIDSNPNAFPRAFVVPSVVVEPDARARLDRLANGPDDLHQVALLDAPPPDNFTGADASVARNAAIVVDEPERVAVEIASGARAFLVLTDQWYPGWHASVNGVATPIQRANHAFRAIEIPAGPARVEFVYRPASVMIGAAMSVVCFLAAAVACLPRSRVATVNAELLP